MFLYMVCVISKSGKIYMKLNELCHGALEIENYRLYGEMKILHIKYVVAFHALSTW